MDLLFKREQKIRNFGGILFRLWAKSEFTEDERALLDRYSLDQAKLLVADDTKQLKWAIGIGLLAFFFVGGWIGSGSGEPGAGLFAGTIAGIGAGFFYFTQRRETIYVKDLLYGRQFKCKSIADLARKEAWLEDACIVMRQVLETAKNWDGVETNPVPVLAKDEAKEVVIKFAWTV